MNQTNLQSPEKKYIYPLLVSAMLMQGLENRFSNPSAWGNPLPRHLPNQRQRRKLAAQNR